MCDSVQYKMFLVRWRLETQPMIRERKTEDEPY